MIIKKELIKRDIAGEVFLVPLGKSMYDANTIACICFLVRSGRIMS